MDTKDAKAAAHAGFANGVVIGVIGTITIFALVSLVTAEVGHRPISQDTHGSSTEKTAQLNLWASHGTSVGRRSVSVCRDEDGELADCWLSNHVAGHTPASVAAYLAGEPIIVRATARDGVETRTVNIRGILARTITGDGIYLRPKVVCDDQGQALQATFSTVEKHNDVDRGLVVGTTMAEERGGARIQIMNPEGLLFSFTVDPISQVDAGCQQPEAVWLEQQKVPEMTKGGQSSGSHHDHLRIEL